MLQQSDFVIVSRTFSEFYAFVYAVVGKVTSLNGYAVLGSKFASFVLKIEPYSLLLSLFLF